MPKRKLEEILEEAEEPEHIPTEKEIQSLITNLKGQIKKGVIVQHTKVFLTLFNAISLDKLLQLEKNNIALFVLDSKMVCQVDFSNVDTKRRTQRTKAAPLDLDALIEIEQRVEFKPPSHNSSTLSTTEYDALIKQLKLVLFNLYDDDVFITSTEISRLVPFYLITLTTLDTVSVTSLLKLQRALEIVDAKCISVAHLADKKALQITLKLKSI